MTTPTIKTNTPVKSFLNSQFRNLNKTIKFQYKLLGFKMGCYTEIKTSKCVGCINLKFFELTKRLEVMTDLGVQFILQEQNEREFCDCISQIINCTFRGWLCNASSLFLLTNICVFFVPAISTYMFFLYCSVLTMFQVFCLAQGERVFNMPIFEWNELIYQGREAKGSFSYNRIRRKFPDYVTEVDYKVDH